MGDTRNLEDADAKRLLKEIYEWLKSMPGKKVKFQRLNGHKRDIILSVGLTYKCLNESEWETAWDHLSTMPGVRIVSGCRRNMILMYTSTTARQQTAVANGRETLQRPESTHNKEPELIIISRVDEEFTKKAAAALLELLMAEGDKGIPRKGALTRVAQFLCVDDITDPMGWARIVKKARRLAAEMDVDIITKDGNYRLIGIGKQESIRSKAPRVIQPEQIADNKLLIQLPSGATATFEGKLIVDAEGPEGRFMMKAHRVSITVTVVVILVLGAVIFF